MVLVTSAAIDLGGILERVRTPASGGIDVFVGTVRNDSDGKRVVGLDYSAYVPMAEQLMREIEAEIRSRWPVHDVVLVHRVGSLNVGDIAVVTAVSSVHRREAFEACRHAIERIKADVPIWKKELWTKRGENTAVEGGRVHA